MALQLPSDEGLTRPSQCATSGKPLLAPPTKSPTAPTCPSTPGPGLCPVQPRLLGPSERFKERTDMGFLSPHFSMSLFPHSLKVQRAVLPVWGTEEGGCWESIGQSYWTSGEEAPDSCTGQRAGQHRRPPREERRFKSWALRPKRGAPTCKAIPS